MNIIVDNIVDAFYDRYAYKLYRSSDCYCSRCASWYRLKSSVGIFKNPLTNKNEALCSDCIEDGSHIGNNIGIIFCDAIHYASNLFLDEKPVYFIDANGKYINHRVASIIE
jgi:hypothetical protein